MNRKLRNWCGCVLLLSCVSGFLPNAIALSQANPRKPAKVSPAISGVKFLSARTYSAKHAGDVAADSDGRARFLRVAIRFPARFNNFALYTANREGDDGVYTLQDSTGRNYLAFEHGTGSYGKEKDGVFRFKWITPLSAIPLAERKSLRFKARIFMRDTTSKSKTQIPYWIDVPVKYIS